MTRPSWDEWFLKQLDVIAERSTCDRGKPACILTKSNRQIASGYAGSPPGLLHCDEVGHLMEFRAHADDVQDYDTCGGSVEAYPDYVGTLHCIQTVHAEANAIAQAASMGHPTEGATAYVTMTPCRDCCKLLIAAGIKRVVVAKRYHAAELSREWFATAGVELVEPEE